jgi:hypothetical protein
MNSPREEHNMRMKISKSLQSYANKRLHKLNLNEELKKMELRGPIIIILVNVNGIVR